MLKSCQRIQESISYVVCITINKINKTYINLTLSWPNVNFLIHSIKSISLQNLLYMMWDFDKLWHFNAIVLQSSSYDCLLRAGLSKIQIFFFFVKIPLFKSYDIGKCWDTKCIINFTCVKLRSTIVMHGLFMFIFTIRLIVKEIFFLHIK